MSHHNKPHHRHRAAKRTKVTLAAESAKSARYAVEPLEQRVLFNTVYLGASAASQSTTPLGINLGVQTYYNTDALFFDVRKEMDAWRQVNSPYSYLPANQLTSTGYPLQNAYTATQMIGYPMGTYTLQYQGNGTITASGMGQIVPGSVSTSNGVTTAQVLVQATTSDNRLLLYATVNPANPNNVTAADSVYNLHLYMPGYNPAQPAPLLNPAVQSRLGPFGTIRMMDPFAANVSTAANWGDRTIPADFSHTSSSGIAYEDAIAMANTLHENLWWNVPVAATPTFMTDLAELIKYGSDGVNPYTAAGGINPVPSTGPIYAGLDPALQVHIEFGNELWHDGFPAESYNITAAYANPNVPGLHIANANPNWNDEWVHAAEQDVYQLHQLYSAFSGIYGPSLASQVGFVLAADTSTSDFTQAAFTYLSDMTPTWGAPSTWIESFAVPTYINVDSSIDVAGLTVPQLIANLNQQVTSTVSGGFVATINADTALVHSYGIKLFSYEGGEGLIPNNVNATVKTQAQTDPGMGQFYTKLLNKWYSLGGSLYAAYDFADNTTTSGDFGLLRSVADGGSPKWDAVVQRLVPMGDTNLDGTVDYNDFLTLQSNYGFSGGVYWQQGDLNGDGVVNVADLQLLDQSVDKSKFTNDQLTSYNAFLANPSIAGQLPESNIIGTSGSYQNDGNTSANVFDGNTATYFDGPDASGDWIGLALGSAYTITGVRYVPRSGFESRMAGGIFQASNDPNFISGVVNLYTITTAPPDNYSSQAIAVPGSYRYVRYLPPAGSYANVAELQFYGRVVTATGTPLITAATTSENTQSASGLVVTAADPKTVSYQITGITNGTLFLNNGTTQISNGQFITLAQAAAGLKFIPAYNLFSTTGTTFSFSAQASTTTDATGLGGTVAIASITVNRTAHTPAITSATTTGGTQSASGLVVTANALDTSDATLGYQITGITGGTLFLHDGVTAVTNNTFITAAQGAAGLAFTPAAGLTSPSSTFTFNVQASVDGTVAGLGGSAVAATITVNPAVATGTPTISAATTNENTQSASGLVITAADPNTVSYNITGITGGTLFLYDGVTAVTNNTFITAAQGAAGLAFTPAAGLTSPSSTFTFNVQASVDGTAAGLGGSVVAATITVNPALATGTPAISAATTNENTQSASGLVITAADPNTVSYKITGVTNGTLFLSDGVTPVTNAQFITLAQAAAALKFTPASNVFSTTGTTFSFSAQASTTTDATGLGGTVAIASITVNRTAHTPAITSATTTGGTQSASGLVVTANALDTSDATLGYQITGITGGTLFLHDGVTAVTNNTFITAAQGAAGLAFTPAAGLTSPSSTFTFNVQASVDGTVAGLGGSAVAATITVNPTAAAGPLGGAVIGNTTNSYDGVSTIAKAVDGNLSSFFDAPTANGNWVGLYLGSSKTITQIKYAPRPYFEFRMVGGIIQVANDANFTNPANVYTIGSTPSSGLTSIAVNLAGYQYVRYLAPAGSYGNIAELQVSGYSGGSADTQKPTAPTSLGATVTATAISLGWTASSDNVGVNHYNVYRNGAAQPVGSPSATSFIDTGLTANTSYSYIVQAVDAAGNVSDNANLTISTATAAATGQLSGNVFGSTISSWDGVSTIAKAVDGNISTSFDAATANGNWVALNLGSPATITQIQFAPRAGFEFRMNGGIFQVATNVNFTNPINIYTVSSTPAGGINTVSVSPGGAYQFIRYLSPAGSYGNIAEFQVVGSGGGSSDTVAPTTPGTITPTPASTAITLNWTASSDAAGVDHYNVFRNGQLIGTPTTASFTDTGLTASTSYSYAIQAIDVAGNTSVNASLTTGTSASLASGQLTATVSGTAGSYDGVSTVAKVIDGNVSSYFDAPNPDGGVVVLNVGSQKTITQIKFAPRFGFESRMNGGVFQVSNDPNFAIGATVTAYTIGNTPAGGLNTVSLSLSGTYQFIRYVAPAGSYGNIAEFQVFGF